jgi:hypothetical protein
MRPSGEILRASGGTCVALPDRVKRLFYLAGVVLVSGCFAPDLRDGVIACGQAGCPPGMSCAVDNLCYSSPPPTRIVLATASNGLQNRVYAYCDGTMREVWRDGGIRTSVAVAWGDADGDHVPELAIASDELGIQLYRMGDQGPQSMGGWMGVAPSRDLAWGDVDGDGQVDLLTASGDAMHILRWYDDHGLDSWWESNQHDCTSVALDDLDGDGAQEIALGTRLESVIVFEHDNNGFHRRWSDDSGCDATAIAWQGDSDDDVAVAKPSPVQILHGYTGGGGGRGGGGTEGGANAGSPTTIDATALAWGDAGGKTLAVGTDGGGLHLYRPDGNGGLSEQWSSDESDPTRSLAWGDLGLAVGNDGGLDRVYRVGDGELTLDWSASEDHQTVDVAWGRWEGGPDPCAW